MSVAESTNIAPASSKSVFEKLAFNPASFWIRTSKPCLIKRFTVLGVAATLNSLGSISMGIPTFMKSI